jgi:hypothetical protein
MALLVLRMRNQSYWLLPIPKIHFTAKLFIQMNKILSNSYLEFSNNCHKQIGACTVYYQIDWKLGIHLVEIRTNKLQEQLYFKALQLSSVIFFQWVWRAFDLGHCLARLASDGIYYATQLVIGNTLQYTVDCNRKVNKWKTVTFHFVNINSLWETLLGQKSKSNNSDGL